MATPPSAQSIDIRFIELMAELFQLDEAEALDFGIYRIIRAHNRKVREFLGEPVGEGEERRLEGGQLLPRVVAALCQAQGEDQALNDLRRQLGLEGLASPDEEAARLSMLESVPAMKPLVLQHRQALVGARQVEAEELTEVFNRLYEFFSRHYEDGDFIVSRRLGSDGARYVRSQGTDVEYRWATEDLVYIKSGDVFTDYPVRLPNGRRLVIAVDPDTLATTRADLKSNDSSRYKLNRVEAIDGGCRAVFDYVKGAAKGKAEFDEAVACIATEVRCDAPLIARELRRYLARNRADYFIHSRLKGALCDDLDVFLKVEVLAVDSLLAGDSAAAGSARVARAVREAGREIIDFLAVLEDFQLALWQKKKLVIGQDERLLNRYIITLDRIARLAGDAFAARVAAEAANNRAQMDEWRALGLLQSGDDDLARGERLLPLPLDTRHFPPAFTQDLIARLTASEENRLDELIDGIALHADNRHALDLMQARFAGRIKCIYIDPPYNTGGDGFPYKDRYRHASWLSMIGERLRLAKPLLASNGAIFVSIDANERAALCAVMDKVFGAHNGVEEIIWVQNTTKNQSPTYSNNHEYVEVYARDLEVAKVDKRMFREPKPGAGDVLDLVERLNKDYPSIEEIEREIAVLFESHRSELRAELEEQGIEYEKNLDTWKGLYSYSNAEYRDAEGRLVTAIEASAVGARIWVWMSDNTSMPKGGGTDNKAGVHTKGHPDYRFYNPVHPVTRKPCPHPKTGWRFPESPIGLTTSFIELDADNRIIWGKTHRNVPRMKKFLHDVDTQVGKSVVLDYTDGEKELTNLTGASRSFPNPKPTTLIARFIGQTTDDGDWVLDFFAGSGTTWHAALNAQHDDHQRRKVILVEGGKHFDDVLIPRLKRTAAARIWKGGRPAALDGAGCFVRVQALESYDDALENLEALEGSDLFARPQAALRYQLFAADSQSIGAWRRPDGATLLHCAGADRIEARADGVQSLVWLLGMRVHRQWTDAGGVILTGQDQQNRDVLVLWRDADADDGTWVEEKMTAIRADRVLTNAPEELAFPGAERLESIEALLATATTLRGRQ